MTKRIFRVIAGVALALSLLALLLIGLLYWQAGQRGQGGWFLFAVGVVLAAGLLASILGYKLSRAIIRPVEQVDPACPEVRAPYPELVPLMTRLSQQNTQLQTQMQELRRRQQEFATITDSMQEGFLILDKAENILSYNAGAIRLLGGETGRMPLNLSADTNQTFRQAVALALAGSHNEQTLTCGERCYQMIANPVWQEELIGAVVMILDVTEREQREHLRREFTANVSHELKTPLTSISGFAEIMMNGLVKREDIPRISGNIYTEAQRLITLVGDIIKLSQMDENSIPVQREAVDLYTVAETVAARLRHAADKRRVTIQVAGTHASVMGVAQILDEMVANLCDNAIKYNREGGTVTITVQTTQQGTRLSVADTGIGIPAADQDHVFERFYRVDKSHSKEIGGTGLGLSIVKHGAAYHGAALSLTSEPDRGTTVVLTF